MNPPFDRLCIERLDSTVVAILKSKTIAERLEMGFAAHRMVKLRLAGHFQTMHPDWSSDEVQAAVARRLLGGTI